MYSYIRMTNGPRAGTTFMLDSTKGMRIGRSIDCTVVLSDPLSSREHATIRYENDAWWLRDQSSRNGSFVNGQKTDEAQLIAGCSFRLGSADFSFEQSETLPNPQADGDVGLHETIVRDQPVDPQDTGKLALAKLSEQRPAQDFLLLHQLSIQLLGIELPDEVAAVSLELLRDRTKAETAGFFWVSDDGQLKPKMVVPQSGENRVSLSNSLTKLVSEQRRAIWICNQPSALNTDSLSRVADAFSIPMIHEEKTVGAVHVYRENRPFDESDFEFAKAVANIMAIALMRARQQATLMAEHDRLVNKTAGFDELIGESSPMQELKSKIKRIGRATGCVLIRGESGAGKELVARALHRASARADRPMLAVNCAAIPRDLMESQLFGHRKGAFTGAESDHIGWFEQANTGTLFLDEVGEMTLEGQAKLLRILEGHPFLPVGGSKEITVDVRIIAATNRDLREFVRDKTFREDLYYRLSVFELYIPPLRDRGNDIEILVDFFLKHFRTQHGRPNLTLSPEARAKLLSYQWPGNVRQLRNVVDSAVVMAELDERIEVDDLGLHDVQSSDELESLRIDYWERKLIKEALGRTKGKVPDASHLLGIGRATLYRKIDEYGIER